MTLLKLEGRYLNLEHVAVVEVEDDGVVVVTPYEVLRLSGPDAERLLLAAERLAAHAEGRLEMPALRG